jgi:hypothetical protein
MSIVSGKVSQAKVAVLMAVDKACSFAAENKGDYYSGPILHALSKLIETVRAERPHDDTCHFGRDAECDCGKPSFTHCRMCGHVEVGK